MDAFGETLAAMPDGVMLMDDPACVWTRSQVDEASARVYTYRQDILENAVRPYCLCVLPYSVIKNPIKLRPYLLETRITCAFFSPSMIRAVGRHFGPYVRTVSMGSESANSITVDKGITLINSYASRETFFTIAEFVVDKLYDECPVGKSTLTIIDCRERFFKTIYI